MNLNTTKTAIIVFFLFFIVSLFATIIVHLKKDTSKFTKILTIISLIFSIIGETSTIFMNFNSIMESIQNETTAVTETITDTTTKTITEKTTTEKTTTETITDNPKDQNSSYEEAETLEENESSIQIKHKFNTGTTAIYRKKFKTTSTGFYGFSLNINSVKNNYKITIYNSKDEEILSTYYDDDYRKFSQKLSGNEYYLIEIESTEGTPEAIITIYYPPKPKQ